MTVLSSKPGQALLQARSELEARAGREVDVGCLHQAQVRALAAKGLTEEVEQLLAKARAAAGDL